MNVLADIGETVSDAGKDVVAGVAFFGGIVAAFGRVLINPRRFRFASLVNQSSISPFAARRSSS